MSHPQWMKDSMARSPDLETESSSKKEQVKKTKKEQQSCKSDTPTQKVPSERTSAFIILNTELEKELEKEEKLREALWIIPPMKITYFQFLELINDKNTERVASGGFGIVYKVLQEKLAGLIGNAYNRIRTKDQTVAIKIFSRSITSITIKEIKEEVSALRAFKNECEKNHIVCYIGDVEVFRKNDKVGDFFVIMEYIEGENLRAGMRTYWKLHESKESQKISIARLIKDMTIFIKQGAMAIKMIHALNFAHNDIKLENFMLEMKNKRLVLVDFGLACQMFECEGGFAGGTTMYYSLEKYTEYKKKISNEKYKNLSLVQLQRADLWAFAIVVETLLSTHGNTNITSQTFEIMLKSPSGYGSAFFGPNEIHITTESSSKKVLALINGYTKLMNLAVQTLSHPIWTEENPWATPDDYITLINEMLNKKK